jgi:hypothetical protein
MHDKRNSSMARLVPSLPNQSQFTLFLNSIYYKHRDTKAMTPMSFEGICSAGANNSFRDL